MEVESHALSKIGLQMALKCQLQQLINAWLSYAASMVESDLWLKHGALSCWCSWQHGCWLQALTLLCLIGCRATYLQELDQKQMIDIRSAWFEECGGPPPGNKCELIGMLPFCSLHLGCLHSYAQDQRIISHVHEPCIAASGILKSQM